MGGKATKEQQQKQQQKQQTEPPPLMTAESASRTSDQEPQAKVSTSTTSSSSSSSNLLKPDTLLVTFEGKTYDIGKYAKIHPGGEAILQQNRGKDVTEALLNQPAHKPVLNFIRRKLESLEVVK